MSLPENLEGAIAAVQSDQTLDQTTETTTSAPEIDPDDLDALEAAAAYAALEAEKNAASGDDTTTVTPPTPGEGTGAATTTEPATPQAEEPKGSQPQPMIPKARLDELIRERDEARLEAARLQGQLEAIQPIVQTAVPQTTQTQPTQREPTNEEKLADVHARQDELAAKFDAGDITYSEMLKEQRALNAEEQAIREAQLLEKVKPATAPQGGGNDLYLEALTKQLEDAHPYVLAFKDRAHFNVLVNEAKKSLDAEGVKLNDTPEGRYTLRKRIAELSDEWGPRFYPDYQVPGKQPQTTQPQPSAAAQARASKLALQASMPPDLSTVTPTGGGGQGGGLTNAQIEAMTEDELLALPKATRDRILGIQSA